MLLAFIKDLSLFNEWFIRDENGFSVFHIHNIDPGWWIVCRTPPNSIIGWNLMQGRQKPHYGAIKSGRHKTEMGRHPGLTIDATCYPSTGNTQAGFGKWLFMIFLRKREPYLHDGVGVMTNDRRRQDEN
jgi:hypothetical protein